MGKFFENKWLDAIVSALIAFLTAISVASCTAGMVGI